MDGKNIAEATNTMDGKRPLTVMILGKTGTGKSSLANTIFGETELFKTNNSPNPETMKTQVEMKRINDRDIKLVDVPGVFGSKTWNKEFLQGVKECQGGIDAFLFVFKVERYTDQEKEVRKEMIKYTTEEAFEYGTVVFTHGDQLQTDTSIKEWAKDNPDLKILVEKCGNRVHVFDNEHWNNSKDPYRSNQVQKEGLVNSIETMTANNGGKPYQSDLLKMSLTDETIEILKNVPPEFLLGALLGTIALVSAAVGVIVSRKKPRRRSRRARRKVLTPPCPECHQHHRSKLKHDQENTADDSNESDYETEQTFAQAYGSKVRTA